MDYAGSGSKETLYILINKWLELFDMPTVRNDEANFIYKEIYKKIVAKFPYGFCYSHYNDDGEQTDGDVLPSTELIGRVRLFTHDTLATHLQVPLIYRNALADVEVTESMTRLIGTDWWFDYDGIRFNFEYWFKRLSVEDGVADVPKIYRIMRWQALKRKRERALKRKRV